MARRSAKGACWAGLLAVALGTAGCHADDNDPKGQAKELEDPVRREHAIVRLQAIYGTRLAEAKGDRGAPAVSEFRDQTAEALNQTYLNHPEDSGNGLRILGLMREIRDPRTLPALIAALDFRNDVSEAHAIAAAQTLAKLDIPAGEAPEVVSALGKALSRVAGSRGVDNRMRKVFIEALGALGHPAASSALVKIMLNDDESQNFLFNVLAGQQLVTLADPKSTGALIQALYICDPRNPAMRMNDVAASALVAIGRPALKPVLKTLAGDNQEANRAAAKYVESIQRKDARAAAGLDERTVVVTEAAYTLGKLGFREAVPPLIRESRDRDVDRAFVAALPLVGINRQPSDTGPIVAALISVYKRLAAQRKPQLLVAMRHLYADETMPFFLHVARRQDQELPAVQLYAFTSYAMLANRAEAQDLKAILAEAASLRPHLKDYEPAIAAAEACDQNVQCWIGRLQDKDTVVVRKAANMLARLARGDQAAIARVVELFGHGGLEVRNEALFAADYMAIAGSQAAVDKIDVLETKESGRSIWNNFKREALPIRARLKARTQS